MGPQKPRESAGRSSGFPYDDLWEELGPPGERLYDHGIDRDIIDRAFKKAKKLGALELVLTKKSVRETLSSLGLTVGTAAQLADRLYYLAGHFYSPRFHKLFGDDPVKARERLDSLAGTAAKLQRLTSEMTPSLQRQFDAVRLGLHAGQRAGTPFLSSSNLEDELADIEKAARTVSAEFPSLRRGSNPKVLQGRWLRQAAEAIENAAGVKIETKVSDAAGKNFRFIGAAGDAYSAYCRLVDRGIATKTMVEAVRAFRRHGIDGPPS